MNHLTKTRWLLTLAILALLFWGCRHGHTFDRPVQPVVTTNISAVGSVPAH